MMKLAMYKGPASTLAHKIAHSSVAWWTNSKYSHCELVVDDLCYSASARDNGIRSKRIDLMDGKWDVFYLKPSLSPNYALDFFEKTKDLKYDWAGVFRFVVPKLPLSDTRWYCSEWCAAALQYPALEYSPEDLLTYARYVTDQPN